MFFLQQGRGNWYKWMEVAPAIVVFEGWSLQWVGAARQHAEEARGLRAVSVPHFTRVVWVYRNSLATPAGAIHGRRFAGITRIVPFLQRRIRSRRPCVLSNRGQRYGARDADGDSLRALRNGVRPACGWAGSSEGVLHARHAAAVQPVPKPGCSV